MESNPQSSSSGICQRLFKLVLGALRRPSALPAPSTRVAINGHENSSSSEIVVDLRHTTASAKDGLILSDHDKTKLAQNGVDKKEREKVKGKGAKKSVSIKGSDRKEVTIHSATMVDDQSQEDTKTRRHWPLLSVASNINEKSQEFIERKKKAMNRNNSLDRDQKK